MVVSSLFMPSIEAIERTTDLNSLENENNIYEAVDILIAEGGGGMTMEEKRKKKERQKKAQEIRKRQKVINEGYLYRWAELREEVLKEKNKINNDPIGDGDFFKLLDEKMAKLKFLEIMLNLIDECNVHEKMVISHRNRRTIIYTEKEELEPPQSQLKARDSFLSEAFNIIHLFPKGFRKQIIKLQAVSAFS